MCTCINVYARVYAHTHTHTPTHTHSRVNWCGHSLCVDMSQINTHMHIHTHMHTRKHTHTHTHTRMHAHAHIHAHTYLYTVTYVCMCSTTHVFTQQYITFLIIERWDRGTKNHTRTPTFIHVVYTNMERVHIYLHKYMTKYSDSRISNNLLYIIYVYLHIHICTYIYVYIYVHIYTCI